MSKYRAVIIEDKQDDARLLTEKLEKLFPQVSIVAVADTIAKAKKAINELMPQLTFFDIELGNQNSFEILKEKTSHPFKIIFVTAYSGYMLDAIRVSAVDYVLKPFTDDDLKNAVNRALEKIESESINELSSKIDLLFHNMSTGNNQNKYISITNNAGMHRVLLSDIIYCSTLKEILEDGRADTKIEFRMISGESIILSKNSTITYFDEILSPFQFAKVSQSFLVNMNHIKLYHKRGSIIKMHGYPCNGKMKEEEITIGDSRRGWFDQYYNDFMK